MLCLPDVAWADLRERFIRIEALGFEVANLPDHFVDWTNPARPWFESWTALTGLAAATTRLRVGTCVTQVALRNPAMFARQVMTLDHVSGGRVEVGLGTGLVGDPSYPMIGVTDWEARERVERLVEYVEIVDRLLRDEVTTIEGAHYRVTGAVMQPRPVQVPRPPIMLAALGPVMMGHAARFADTWNSMSFKPSFDEQAVETRDRTLRMTDVCAAAGRDRSTMRWSYLLYDVGARPRGGIYDCYESVDRFEDMAGRILDLGMDEIVVYFPPDELQWPVFERVATDVLPRLRARVAPG